MRERREQGRFEVPAQNRLGYDICSPCANAGVVSPIVGYAHATRAVELLLAPPFPIEVGDIGIVRPGCDGLRVTCRDKYNNLLNNGADYFSPNGRQILEPAGDPQ